MIHPPHLTTPLRRAWRVLWVLSLVALASAQARAAKTPLDDYIAKPDPAYSWKLANTIQGEGYKAYVIDLTSQTWRSEKEVNQTVWKHWLTIIHPDGVKSSKAFLYIAGGGNGEPVLQKVDPLSLAFAKNCQTVVAELRQIPNQPLTFIGTDNKPRKEDDILAYTWVKVMDTGDPTWCGRFPMVKAAVRAMDAIQEFSKSPEGGGTPVDGFVVAGGSKRGWTTWLTGAVDKRVVAIMPAVIDILNVAAVSRHHLDAYGFWATAIGDYYRQGCMQRTGTKEYDFLMSFEDPISYADRLTMPKYIVNASGDEFFVPDGSQYYWDKLKGPKYLRYVPNSKHGLDGTDAPMSIGAFYSAIVNGTKLPEYTWKLEGDDAIRVKANGTPKEVNLWQAVNPTARDFRVDTIGRTYKKTPLTAEADGTYVGRVPKPDQGWAAFFVELVYDGGAKYPLKFTTQVRVVPDTLPGKGLDPKTAPYEVDLKKAAQAKAEQAKAQQAAPPAAQPSGK